VKLVGLGALTHVDIGITDPLGVDPSGKEIAKYPMGTLKDQSCKRCPTIVQRRTAAIEELTGVNFFRDLPNAKETAVEQFQATQLWERN
jgi:hypothetical protein